MKRIKIIKTATNKEDCDECCFEMTCRNYCTLNKGYHYEVKKKLQKKMKT